MAARPMHPWERSYPADCRWDVPIETSTIPELLDRAARAWGDRPALEYRGHRITYRALASMVDRLAAGLLRLGMEPGEAVALHLPNTPFHPVCFFAAARAGIRIVHLSALDARRELAHKLEDSGARTVVTTDLPGLLPNALWLLESGAAERVLMGEDALWGGSGEGVAVQAAPWAQAPWGPRVLPLRPLMAEAPDRAWPAVSPGDVALLQYTGGTTGLPKGAMLTHGNLTAAVNMYRAWNDGEHLEAGAQRVLGVLPLFHIYALTAVLLRHLSEGNEVLLRPRFEAEAVLDDIEEKRATVFSGVPTMWIALLNHPGVQGRDFSSLRSCVSGGAPMPFEVEQRVERLLGRRLRGGWGMTETGPAGTRVPLRAAPRPGLIGAPLPGIEMCVAALDDPGRVLPAGETGEICIRGPNVFKGYWKQPEATARAFHDGFFLTGDIGRMDTDGLFVLLDRKKNMIISSGYNVYPAAIENAIYEHPDVEEAVVIGVPDPYRGQAAKAFLKLREGTPEMTLDDLKAFLADRVGRHEMPAAVELRPALPRSAAGKLLAGALAEQERARAVAPGAAPEVARDPAHPKPEGTQP